MLSNFTEVSVWVMVTAAAGATAAAGVLYGSLNTSVAGLRLEDAARYE